MHTQTTPENPNQAELLSQELFLSSLVHELTRVLLSATKISEAVDTFLLGANEIMGTNRNLLLRVSAVKKRRFTVEHSLGLPQISARSLRVNSGHKVVATCLEKGLHKWVEAPAMDDPFSSLGGSQYLLVPILVPKHGQRLRESEGKDGIALLWVDTSPPAAPLTAQAISHLSVLSQQAGFVLENFRIRDELSQAYAGMKKANKELQLANDALEHAQKRLHADLEQARQLQGGLLPRIIPSHLLRDFASRYVPAGQVGGDYYDCFEVGPDRLDMVIADVSGHGTSAALVMTMFKVLLKTLAPRERSPARILERIHQTFLEDLDGRHFVTVFYAVFDREERALTYSSAGHIPQFLIEPDEDAAGHHITDLTSHGLVIGMFPNLTLAETRLEVGPKARLVLYTDGISEAHGPQGMFGFDRFRSLVLSACGESAEHLGNLTMKALADFRQRSAAPVNSGSHAGEEEDELADDVTLAILDL